MATDRAGQVRALLQSARRGSADEVQNALQNLDQAECAVLLRGTDNMGNTPLHIASFWGKESCVLALLQFGADCSARNDLGHTAGDVAGTERVRQCIADHLASRLGHREGESGRKLSAGDEEASAPHKARAELKRKQQRLVYLRQFREKEKTDVRPQSVSSPVRAPSIDSRPSDGSDGRASLIEAIRRSRTSTASSASSSGEAPRWRVSSSSDADFPSALSSRRRSSRRASIGLAVDVQLDAEYDSDHDGEDTDLESTSSGDVPASASEKRWSSDSSGSSSQKSGDALARAARSGDLDRLRQLLAKDDLDIDARDRFGWTALQRAAFWDREACVTALLEAGAKPLLVAPRGENCIELAASSPVRRLLRAAATRRPSVRFAAENDEALRSTTSTDHRQLLERRDIRPPHATDQLLLTAAQQGDTAALGKALEKGASVDAHSADGRTAIQIAVFWGHADAVRRLAAAGASLRPAPDGRPLEALAPSESMRALVRALRTRSSASRSHGSLRYASRTASFGDVLRAAGIDENRLSLTPARAYQRRRLRVDHLIDQLGGNAAFDAALDLERVADDAEDPDEPGAASPTSYEKRASRAPRRSTSARKLDASADSHAGSDAERLEWAALYVRDAVGARDTHVVRRPGSAWQLRAYRAASSSFMRTLATVALITQLAVVAWEPTSQRELVARGSRWGQWPPSWRGAFITNAVCVFVHLVHLCLDIFLVGKRHFGRQLFERVRAVIVVAMGADAVFAGVGVAPPLTRVLRPVLLVLSMPRTRRLVVALIRVLPRLGEVVVVFFLFFITYAVIGVQMFSSGEFYERGPVDEKVSSFTFAMNDIQSVLTALGVLITTANYPNVMYPAYRQNPGVAAAYFVSFLVFGVYLFLNLVLPMVYKSYKESRKQELLREATTERRLMAAAFAMLARCSDAHAGDESVRKGMQAPALRRRRAPNATSVAPAAGNRRARVLPFAVVLKLLQRLRPDITEDAAHFMFDAADRDQDGFVDVFEFASFVDLIHLEFELAGEVETPRELLLASIAAHARGSYALGRVLRVRAELSRVFASRMYVLGVVLCVIANAAVLGAVGSVGPEGRSALRAADDVFVVLFIVEAALKIFAFRPSRYFTDAVNQFDFFVSLAALSSFIVQNAMPDGESLLALLLGAIKVARIFRLFSLRANLREFIATVFDVVPAVSSMIVLLLAVMYVFAVVGMEMFSGRYLNLYDAIELSFNSFGEAMLILFQMLMQATWDQIVIAGRDTVGVSLLLYAFLFEAISVYIVLNVVAALVLETFEFQHDMRGAGIRSEDQTRADAVDPQQELRTRVASEKLAHAAKRAVDGGKQRATQPRFPRVESGSVQASPY